MSLLSPVQPFLAAGTLESLGPIPGPNPGPIKVDYLGKRPNIGAFLNSPDDANVGPRLRPLGSLHPIFSRGLRCT